MTAPRAADDHFLVYGNLSHSNAESPLSIESATLQLGYLVSVLIRPLSRNSMSLVWMHELDARDWILSRCKIQNNADVFPLLTQKG
jgi:hypothetical protein